MNVSPYYQIYNEKQSFSVLLEHLKRGLDFSSLTPVTLMQAEVEQQITVKQKFTLDHLVQKDARAASSSPAITSLDQLMIMDLDVYNYISAFLFDGMGTEEQSVQTLDIVEKQQVFRNELLSSNGMLTLDARFFETLKHPEYLPTPILKRLSIGIALLAIERLTELRNIVIDQNGEFESILSYNRNKEMAECYNQFLHFLQGDSLTVQEKQEEVVIGMIVEFKALVFLYLQ
jgi:hypothetical protein